MKQIIMVAVCLLCFCSSQYAQRQAKIPYRFMQAMQGDWKGKLTYTDYQDDSSQVTMDVWLKSKMVNKQLIKQFYYKEPDGNTKQKAKSQDTAYLSNNGANWVESGYALPFTILQYVTNKLEQMVVMETTDEDNEKKSTIRTTITVSADKMTIRKEVKYVGTTRFFVRHTFYYTK